MAEYSRWLAQILLINALVVQNIPAQNARLVWKWDEGNETQYQLTEHMHQTISGPFSTDLLWTREVGFSDRVLTHNKSTAAVERAFQWVSITVKRDGGKTIRHDTRKPHVGPGKTDPLLIEPFIALAGRSVVFTVDGEGRVTNLQGSGETLDAMLGPLSTGNLAPGLSAFSRQPSREQRLASQLEQALRIIPAKAVSHGDRWQIRIDHLTPFAGQLSTDITATLKRWNSRDQTALIEFEGVLRQVDAEEEVGPHELVPITLESGVVAGTIRFDVGRGQIQHSEIEMKTVFLAGQALTPADGQQMRQTIIQKATLERLADNSANRGAAP